MKTFLQRTLLFVMAMLLAGCAHQQVDRVITKTVYVVVTPDTKYLQSMEVPAPPAKRVYAQDEKPDFEVLYKEQALSSISLYKAINSCNADKFGAQEDIAKKRKLYD